MSISPILTRSRYRCMRGEASDHLKADIPVRRTRLVGVDGNTNDSISHCGRRLQLSRSLLSLPCCCCGRWAACSIPFCGRSITAYLLNPLVRVLAERSRIRRIWWVLLLYVIVGVLIFAGSPTLWPRLVTQFTDLQAALPEFAARVPNWFEQRGTFTFGGYCDRPAAGRGRRRQVVYRSCQ